MKKWFMILLLVIMMMLVPLIVQAHSSTVFLPHSRTSNSTYMVTVRIEPDSGYTMSTVRYRWTNSMAYSTDHSWYTHSITVNSMYSRTFTTWVPGVGTWYLHVLTDSQRSGAFGGSFHRLYSRGGVYIVTMPLPPVTPPQPPLIGIYFWEPFTITRTTQYRWDIEREFEEIPGYEEEVNLEVTYEVRKGTVSLPINTYLTK